MNTILNKFFMLAVALMMSLTTWAQDPVYSQYAEIDVMAYTLYGYTQEAEVTSPSSGQSYEMYTGAVTIPSSVTYEGVTYNVTSIGYKAFNNCWMLTSVSMPNSLKSIYAEAFAYCNLLTSITIPDSVKNIYDEAFSYCTKLTSVTIPNSVIFMGEYVFRDCYDLSSVTFGSGLKSIMSGNFYNCNSLESITIPSNITSIDNYAFKKCDKLKTIELPNTLEYIKEQAFYQCRSLTTLIIPNSVEEINRGAFRYCSSLSSVTNLSRTPQSIDESVFSTYGTLHVLEGCKEVYQNAAVWKNFNIIEDAEEILGISDIGSDTIAADKIFSISGKRLSTPQKGINIINGKKIVIK